MVLQEFQDRFLYKKQNGRITTDSKGRVKLALPFYCFSKHIEHLFQCLTSALNLEKLKS